jgi:hypothetical protein
VHSGVHVTRGRRPGCPETSLGDWRILAGGRAGRLDDVAIAAARDQ